MSVKPVAWTPWESAGYLVFSMQDGVQHHIASVHRYEHVPLVKSAPELAEALQLAIKELKRLRNCDDDEFSTFNWHDTLQAIEGGSKLLARITPK